MKYEYQVIWLVIGFNTDCLSRNLGVRVECPPWGFFYGILVRIEASFGEIRTAPNGLVDKRDRGMNLTPPVN